MCLTGRITFIKFIILYLEQTSNARFVKIGYQNNLDILMRNALWTYFCFSSSCFRCSSSSSGLVNLRLRPLWLVYFPGKHQTHNVKTTRKHIFSSNIGSTLKKKQEPRDDTLSYHVACWIDRKLLEINNITILISLSARKDFIQQNELSYKFRVDVLAGTRAQIKKSIRCVNQRDIRHFWNCVSD